VGILGWILLGLLAGALAKAFLPGRQPGGIVVTTAIGVVGALVAGALAGALGFGDPIDEFFDLSTWVAAAAVAGAALLLVIWNAIAGRSRRRLL
jgi:uncharacterized membrane protein YeaQ/YmgE (transglycosylase-associated protein family)